MIEFIDGDDDAGVHRRLQSLQHVQWEYHKYRRQRFSPNKMHMIIFVDFFYCKIRMR